MATDRSQAAVTIVSTVTGRGVTPGTIPIPGLDRDRRYRLRVRHEAGLAATLQGAPLAWWERATVEGVLVSGAALDTVGLALPVLMPAQGFLLHLEPAPA